MSRALVMHPKDNVATVLEDVSPEQSVEIEGDEKTLRRSLRRKRFLSDTRSRCARSARTRKC